MGRPQNRTLEAGRVNASCLLVEEGAVTRLLFTHIMLIYCCISSLWNLHLLKSLTIDVLIGPVFEMELATIMVRRFFWKRCRCPRLPKNCTINVLIGRGFETEPVTITLRRFYGNVVDVADRRKVGAPAPLFPRSVLSIGPIWKKSDVNCATLIWCCRLQFFPTTCVWSGAFFY